MTYEESEENPAEWANPAPFPTFRTLPEPTRTPLAFRPEAGRDPLPEPGMKPTVETPVIVEQTLDNGIEVIAAQTGDVPFATMTDLVPGGAKSDERAKAGVANLAADLPEACQAAVYAGIRAPSRSGEDYIALDLANAVLGGGSSGRLLEEVRTKRSISYGAYSGFPARADDAYLVATERNRPRGGAGVSRRVRPPG